MYPFAPILNAKEREIPAARFSSGAIPVLNPINDGLHVLEPKHATYRRRTQGDHSGSRRRRMEVRLPKDLASIPDFIWLMDEYRYEMRRDCQEIIPGLLLGPFLVSRNKERLKQLGVTHM
jgi:hypothetical protein